MIDEIAFFWHWRIDIAPGRVLWAINAYRKNGTTGEIVRSVTAPTINTLDEMFETAGQLRITRQTVPFLLWTCPVCGTLMKTRVVIYEPPICRCGMRTWNDVAHLTLRRYDAWEGQSATMRAADEAMLKMYLAA